MDPSGFCFHFESVGTPGGAVVEDFLFEALPPPKNEKAGLVTGAGVGAGFGLDFGSNMLRVPDRLGIFGSFWGVFLVAPPNKFKVPARLGILGSFLGAGVGEPPKRLRVPARLGILGSSFGEEAGEEDPNRLNVPALSGTLGVSFLGAGAGELPKILKEGDGFKGDLTAGVGEGEDGFLVAGAPKKLKGRAFSGAGAG